MNERNLEREELRVEKLIKEKDDGTTKTVENPKRGYYPVKEKEKMGRDTRRIQEAKRV